MHWEAIQRFEPTVLIAVPSFLLKLIEYAEGKNSHLSKTSVKKVLCIGENIRTPEFLWNTLGARITQDWDVQLYSTYASTEQQTAFTECGHGQGGHHHPDLLVFEILDDNNAALPPGSFGELTITTLGVEGMPLIRYKTGDICTYHTEPCACGRKSYRLSPIIGRKQQMIKYSGTTLFPQDLFNVMHAFPDIADYVIQLTLSSVGTDQLCIHITHTTDQQSLALQLKHAFQSRIRIIPELRFTNMDTINRIQQSQGRKVSRFIDARGG
jgi:phenylacetate-CoA ligase